jgi:hypothetical protein
VNCRFVRSNKTEETVIQGHLENIFEMKEHRKTYYTKSKEIYLVDRIGVIGREEAIN